MGKKFITINLRTKSHKLFTQDIRKVYTCQARKLPLLPQFEGDSDNHE